MGVNNLTSEISEGKDASLKVVVDNATKVAKEIEEIAERTKEGKDEKEKVDLAKEAEKELKTVEQAKAVVEKALDELKEEEEIKRNGSNKESEEIKRALFSRALFSREIIQTLEESEKSLNLSNKLEQSLNNFKGVSEAKKEAEKASEKAREAVEMMKVELQKIGEPTKHLDADTKTAVEDQIKTAKKLGNKAEKLTNSAVD